MVWLLVVPETVANYAAGKTSGLGVEFSDEDEFWSDS